MFPFQLGSKSDALTSHRHYTNLLKNIPELFLFNILSIHLVERELKVYSGAVNTAYFWKCFNKS